MAYADPPAGARRQTYSPATVASLTGITGTANNALTDVGSSFNQGTLNDNFADLATKLNAILVELRKAGVISS